MNRLLEKIIKGGGDRPTRFHDERGNIVTPGGYFFAVNSFVTTFLNHFFGYYPPTPWLSYRAQHYIARLLQSHWTILEFGSGMSTVWFARRCQKVYSIEHNPKWHSIVQKQLEDKKVDNVVYSLRDGAAYADLSEFPDHLFDFALVDGIGRTECVRNLISKIKPGGWIYLDNTDMNARSNPMNDNQQAEQLLLSNICKEKDFVKYFTDFVPTNFLAKQGLLVNLSKGQ